MDIIEGREYDVVIPPLHMVGGKNSTYFLDDGDGLWAPRDLARLGAVITEVTPPEPTVGSVWVDAGGVTITRNTLNERESIWYAVQDCEWLAWPEVVALGGSLIHDAGAQS